MALPRGAMGLSAVCDCGISLIILTYYFCVCAWFCHKILCVIFSIFNHIAGEAKGECFTLTVFFLFDVPFYYEF